MAGISRRSSDKKNDYGEVYGRINSLETSHAGFATAIQHLSDAMVQLRDDVHEIGIKVQDSNQTDWRTLAAICGVFVTLSIVIGSMALDPIRMRQDQFSMFIEKNFDNVHQIDIRLARIETKLEEIQ